MKPRHKWLNDILMSTKPGRHQNKKKKKLDKEDSREIRYFRHRKKELYEHDDHSY